MNGSKKIREFYERMPYPGPVTTLDKEISLNATPEWRQAHFYLTWPAKEQRDDLDILVAGCGTSQAARYAVRLPNSRVTAIDISRTSLDHTRDLKNKYKLRNLELHQIGIEEVDQIRRDYDLIVCTGVLHHLPDPDSGLRALRRVLRPQGAMRLMVYARYGRIGIYMMQEYCRLLGIDAMNANFEELGSTLQVLPADHPIKSLLTRAKDFRRPDSMADALLNPQDRAYTVQELHAWLGRCGMSFGRWNEQAPYSARCGALAKAPHAARLALLPPRLQHSAVELFRGTMTTHSFIAYRDDCPKQTYAVDFEEENWDDYVPIWTPRTICIRDRLPPGSVAVLINRSHTFPDLVLTVDPFEDQLVRRIDGTRSLRSIVDDVANNPEQIKGAIGFIEKLWLFDQIVIDNYRGNTK